MGKEATNSMRSVPAVLRYLAVVVVQDALEDAEELPENPVHAYLQEHPLFQCAFFMSHAIKTQQKVNVAAELTLTAVYM